MSTSRIASTVAIFTFGLAALGGAALTVATPSHAETSDASAASSTTPASTSPATRTGGNSTGSAEAVASNAAGAAAHKDNPTQSPISKPIVLLFVAPAMLFIPPTESANVVPDSPGASASSKLGSAPVAGTGNGRNIPAR